MAKRIVVCSSYTGLTTATNRAISALLTAGWAGFTQTGCADVALARNMALTLALKNVPDDPEYVILMVDDDMVFSRNDAERMCDASCRLRQPVSGIYSTARASIAATPFGDRYLTGLGFLAIPAPSLYLLAERSRKTMHEGEPVIAFTWTGPPVEHEQLLRGGQEVWMSEDYRLVLRLGGAFLAPIPVGHMKRVPLYPDEETIEKFGQAEVALAPPEKPRYP